jgi:HPt (histidine-containing phosphotransfer) domain-containing protein
MNRRRTPIVAITANAVAEERDRCLMAGMDEVLLKPLERHKLRELLIARLGEATPDGPDESHAGMAAPFDRSALVEMFGDDQTTITDILDSFIVACRSTAIELQAAHTSRVPEEIRFAAHKLKSSARAVGAHTLAELCAALERAARVPAMELVDELAPPCILSLELVAGLNRA